ncbi:MAG: riboflavin biosynthesis protein RibF [Planctomycetota bacterium]|nr:riboflavin biosynthesis protein RibF [Planctomycetota bacterium]
MSTLKAISIGTFDAIHVGHQAIIAAARKAVGEQGIVALHSFDPPPISVLKPTLPFHRLTAIDNRVALLKTYGVDEVSVLAPRQNLLEMSPEAFVLDLVEKHQPDVIVEGENFRFGKDRSGTIETLESLGEMHGFKVISVAQVERSLNDQSVVQVSSSLVRWLLQHGRVEDVATLLGRSYVISGAVVKGDQRGRTIGFPTANMSDIQTMLPKDGVYAGETTIEGKSYPVALSVGTKPTFNDSSVSCEAHIIGFEGKIDHYEWKLTVTITAWIRNQVKFDTIKALIDAIQKDVERALEIESVV